MSCGITSALSGSLGAVYILDFEIRSDTMENDLFEIVYCHPALKEGDLQEIKDAHIKITFPKGELFLQSGKTANE